nr:hypothetical protein [uncultured Psychroserpens sp.]
MPKQEEIFDVKLRMTSVKVLKFMVDDAINDNDNDFYNTFKTDLKNNLETDVENEEINITLESLFYTYQNEEKFSFIELKVNFTFNIIPLRRLVSEQTNVNGVKSFVFKNDKLLLTITSLAYSTMRGILIEKLSNSKFKNKLFLPIVDPRKLLQSE